MKPSQPLWEHPAIAGIHVVSMTREYPEFRKPLSAATCTCGWSSRIAVGHPRKQDRAVTMHWLSVIKSSRSAA